MLRQLVGSARRSAVAFGQQTSRYGNTLRTSSATRFYHSLDDRAPVIDGTVDTNDEAFKKNYADMTAVIGDLRSDLETIKLGGGEKARELHQSRNKMLARDVGCDKGPGSAREVE